MADNGPRETLEEIKRKQRHAQNQRTWASVARLGSRARERMYKRASVPHPISNSVTRRAFNARQSGWHSASALTLTAKPRGAHGMPVCQISVPRLARLVSSFLGVSGKRPPIPLSALSSGSAHVPSSFASARAIMASRGVPLRAHNSTARALMPARGSQAYAGPPGQSSIARLARAFGHANSVRKGPIRTSSVNRASKSKSKSKSKRKAKSA